METSELLERFVNEVESLQLLYLITGSMATVAYGEPRFTNDVDAIVELPLGRVDDFCAAFPSPEFYCSKEAVRQAIVQKFQFNIIHPQSGLKIDVIIPKDTVFDRDRLSRRVRMPTDEDFEAWFASPEDVIIKKLEYYQEGGSEKHVRDIIGVLKVRQEQVDMNYIEKWVSELGLSDTWAEIMKKFKPDDA